MGNLFSKKSKTTNARRKPPPITDRDRAILDLKLKRDEIQRCVRRHEYQLENQRRVAKELLQSGKKELALMVLRRKHILENLIKKSLDHLDTLEKMVYSIEEADMQNAVVKGLKAGNQALKQINQMFSVDEVEKIMDETQEAVQYQEEISRILEDSGMQLDEHDMEEINAELNNLIESDNEAVKFPSVPDEPLPSKGLETKERSKDKRVEAVALVAS